MTKAIALLPLAAASLLLAACAGDISPSKADTPVNPPTEVLPGPGGAQSTFTKTAAGTYTAAINASGEDWIYLDIDSQTQVFPATPEASDEWDLAHRGAEIKLNGGASGTPPGGQAVLVFGDKGAVGTPYPFETVSAAPPPTAVDYRTDATTSQLPSFPAIPGAPALPLPDPTAGVAYAMLTYPAADQEPNQATGAGDYGWYRNGGLPAETITPRGNVGYVLRTVECRYYKLRMTAYAAGRPEYEFLEIPGAECRSGGSVVAPLGRATFTASGEGYKVAVDSTDDEAWVHLSFGEHVQVVPATPDNDPQGWDIALRRTDIKINGGVSGSGTVLLNDQLRDDWAARSKAPAVTDSSYHTDETDQLAFITYPARERGGDAACGGINGDFGWYYYSAFCDDGEGIHHISPRAVVYVLRGSDGRYWKLRMLGYYDGAGSSAHPSLEFAPVAAP